MLDFFYKAYRMIVKTFFGLMIALLTFLALISTSRITAGEHTLFVDDLLRGNLLVLLGVLLCLAVLGRMGVPDRLSRRLEEEVFFRKSRKTLLVVLGMLALFWVMATLSIPQADQYMVQRVAYEMRVHDFTDFAPGGYASVYPNQLGLILVSYVLSLLFGNYNFVVFELMNAAALVWFYDELTKAVELEGGSRKVQLGTLILGILFFPLTMYTSFVYGNLIGLALGMAAIRKELLFLKKPHWKTALWAALHISLAVFVKNNYLIFLIAMVIVFVMEMVKRHSLKGWYLPVALLLGFALQTTVPRAITERVTGYDLDRGVSSWAWVAMGMQEGDMAPGWYNEYNYATYLESDNDPEIQELWAKENIKAAIRAFREDGGYAGEFFLKKTASQWNNPDFQAFWNVNAGTGYMITKSNWAYRLLSMEGQDCGSWFLNYLQLIILAGALLFALGSDSKTSDTLILILTFVGGFLFHTIWEAKCQYTIEYFVLLLPYCCQGYEKWCERMSGKLQFRKLLENIKTAGWQTSVLRILVLLSVVILAGCYKMGCMTYLAADTEEWDRYVSQNITEKQLENGYYRIRSSAQEGKYMTAGDAKEVFYVYTYQGVTRILADGTTRYLNCVSMSSESGAGTISFEESQVNGENQKWKLKEADDDSFYICFWNDALTEDAETGMIVTAPFDETEAQKWEFIAVQK